MKHWVVSCALHGTAVLGAVALAWFDPPVEVIREPLRWQVALADSEPPPQHPAARERPIPNPPMPTASAMTTPPDPADSTAEPPVESVPTPMPSPAGPAPSPGSTAMLADPVPPPEPGIPPPPVSLPSAAQAARAPQLAPARSIPQAVLTPAAVTELPAAPSPALVDPRPAPASPAPPAPPVRTAVPASLSPMPEPRAQAAAEVERRWYLALLEHLRGLQRYPLAARRLSQEGIVLVEARIGADGRLENAAIKRGSGFPLLDRDALRLLETAAEAARGRLKPERPTRLEIPIAYRLQG